MTESQLEDELKKQDTLSYRSEGERRIADFLKTNQIRYHYEQGLLVYSPEGQPRLWYPDFYLPEFGAYVEYYGLAGRQSYDQGVKRKLKTYEAMGHEVISLYLWSFAEDWKGYLMSELRDITQRRYEKLMTKAYWRNSNRPSYGRSASSRNGYKSKRGMY